MPDSPFASSAPHLVMFGESIDNNGSDLWSPSSDNDDNSTPSTLSDSNSFNCQMPRFGDSTLVNTSAIEYMVSNIAFMNLNRLLPIGMLPGGGGTGLSCGNISRWKE